MAGAGFKTFNTGDVLTASDVNTYLMQQTVMVFASSAARTTALGANVAEGMISYLKDTNAVEVYDGSNWVSSDDPNAIQNAIVDAKGDIITATAADTPARLAVGTSGNILAADSSTATGLAYVPTFFAGKNKIINGDFGIWQRGTSFGGNVYTADRWYFEGDTTSSSVSQQSFTAGTAPVAGYEGTFFARVARGTGGTFCNLQQKIEDVRTFAGQTITLSFWAKASSATTIQPAWQQNFGSGGSGQVAAVLTSTSITTSWARYSFTISLPSISGKTIGTGSNLAILVVRFDGSTNVNVDVWGVQVEAGSTVTQFQTATGTIQGELAACQRYYAKSYIQGTAPATNSQTAGLVYLSQTANAGADNRLGFIKLPVNMRTAPTVTIYSFSNSTAGACSNANGTDQAANSGLAQWQGDTHFVVYNGSGGTLTAANGGYACHYVASAEL